MWHCYAGSIRGMLSGTVPLDVLDAIVAPSTVFTGEALLSITPDGLELSATDKARVAWVEISLSATAFESYEAAPMETALDLARVDTILNLLDGRHPISISIDPDEHMLSIYGPRLSYRSALLDPTTVPAVFETLDTAHPAKVRLSGAELNQPVELADLAASRLSVSVDPAQDHITGRADDLQDSVYFELPADDGRWLRPDDGAAEVALDYLAPVQRTIPDDVAVTLALRDRESLSFQYPIADGAGNVTFTLAASI